MKKIFILLFTGLVLSMQAEESTVVRLELHNMDFSHSTQKEEGKRVGLGVIHKIDRHRFRLLYERTDTETFQPPLPKDLEVNKYALGYDYHLKHRLHFHASYIFIEDNLVTTDGGVIYGAGVSYANLHFWTFYSDYTPFDVLQGEVRADFKYKIGALALKTTLVAKHQTLQDYTSNPLSKNAKKHYFTPGVNIHGKYRDYFGGAGVFFGKRVFAVMDDGMRVQHHGMEFEKSYMFGLGKKIDTVSIMIKYGYMVATELPKSNEDVGVRSFKFVVQKKF